MSDKVLTESELIAMAREDAERDDIEDSEQALKVLAGDQSYWDDVEGSVTDWPFVHVTRIANWLLVEGEQGFSHAEKYPSCEHANETLEYQRALWQESEAMRPRDADELQEGDYVKVFKYGQFLSEGRVFYDGEPGVIRIGELRIERDDPNWSFRMADPEEANG